MAACSAIPALIVKKRNGQTFTTEEIKYFIQEVVNGRIQQCQLGAMLMAIYLKDLTDEETVCLTREMMNSGAVLGPWPEEWKGKVVDKHSTGGVGDKISLILAPALAACGMKVPMVSGRGLEHTGGTLDKLESIPGLQVCVTKDKMKDILEEVGCCIVGQTDELVPADKEMYKVRDVTGTVDHIGLITGSIISKKAAEQLDVLVLDVKFGVGAVIKEKDKSRELAKKMVISGENLGINTVAMLTDMNNPIGKKIGNALEVVESIDCLHGNGPRDLEDLVLKQGGQLLCLVKKAKTIEEGENKIKETLYNGEAAKKFEEMIIAQGVDREKARDLCVNPAAVLPKANVTNINCQKTGFVYRINSRICGKCSLELGAGRKTSTATIKYAVGLEICVDIGDKIKEGDPWIKVHHDCDVIPDAIKSKLMEAIDIQPTGPKSILSTRVSEIISYNEGRIFIDVIA